MRGRVSTQTVFGDSARYRWRSLRRWRGAVAALFWAQAATSSGCEGSAPQLDAQTLADPVCALIGRAPPEVATEPAIVRAVCGASSMLPGADWLMAIRAASKLGPDPPERAGDGPVEA
ncbi:MAG: hypothetical protein H6699_11310 [Myxococcales bacterium]|nr:hypothetical protein [Myxococcales bacterium]